MRVNSAALRVAPVNRVSVIAYAPGAGAAWRVLPHAAKPPAKVPVGVLATNFKTMDVGTPGVRVLLIRSLRTDSEASPFGVTGQEQQEINCSSGENVNTFTQSVPFCEGKPTVELVPVLVISINESPTFKLEK